MQMTSAVFTVNLQYWAHTHSDITVLVTNKYTQYSDNTQYQALNYCNLFTGM